MGVADGGGDVAVPEKPLDHVNVQARAHQFGGDRIGSVRHMPAQHHMGQCGQLFPLDAASSGGVMPWISRRKSLPR